MPNIVFTDESTRSMVDRYGSRPENQWPFVYRLAIEDKYKDAREKIERIVAGLSGEAQRKLIGNLHSKENCTHAYNELMVGETLMKKGFIAEYEQNIDGKTPDWLITTPKTKIKAIV
jgi:hypothetical protein